MKINQRAQLNNKGLSLVELIVAILLSSAVMAMLVVFISYSRNLYETVNTDATLQTEAQAAKSFINEIAIEATAVGNFTYEDSSGNKGIWFRSPSNSYMGVNLVSGTVAAMDYNYYFVLFESDSKVLRYCAVPEGDDRLKGTDGSIFGTGFSFKTLFDTGVTGTSTYGDPYALLAEHVTDISCASSADGLVTVNLGFEFDSKPYSTVLNVAARNLK